MEEITTSKIKDLDYYLTPADKFKDLTEDEDFQSDLKSFFQGGRYNMSDAEIAEAGREGMRDKFIEHMRFQSWNDFTAVKDLNYVGHEAMRVGPMSPYVYDSTSGH